MRHNVAGRLFGRTANQRKALLRGLVGSLFEHERIETTLARAKETRKIAEKLVTLGKRGDLHAKRLVMSRLPNRSLVVKLFDSIAPRFADRNGGYLRIVQTRRREKDQAQMAVLEFVDYEDRRGGKPEEEKKKDVKKTVRKKEAKKEGEKQEAKKEAKKEEKKVKKKATPKTTSKEEAKGEGEKSEKKEVKKKTVKKTAAKRAAKKEAPGEKGASKRTPKKKGDKEEKK